MITSFFLIRESNNTYFTWITSDVIKQETNLKPLLWIIPLKHWEISYPQNCMPGLKIRNKSQKYNQKIRKVEIKFIYVERRSRLTLSTKSSSCATNNLSLSRVLLTDAWWPTANKRRSSGLAEQCLSNISFLVGSKLDTNAGIPSSSPTSKI